MPESKIIDFQFARNNLERKKAGNQEAPETKKTQGKLVWLYCPRCKTCRYTHVLAPDGRTHRCGTQVLEDEVELDLRAEAVLALHNVRKLRELEEASENSPSDETTLRRLKNGIEAEEEYVRRLESVAGYAFDDLDGESVEDSAERTGAEKNALSGIYLTPFRIDPLRRFPIA